MLMDFCPKCDEKSFAGRASCSTPVEVHPGSGYHEEAGQVIPPGDPTPGETTGGREPAIFFASRSVL
jgi:hypothetical protein